MNKKIRKTVFVPVWIARVIDFEGIAYDGPGVVIAAAIHHFSNMTKDEKVKTVQEYLNREVSLAYEDESEAAGNSATLARIQKKRGLSKSG